MRLFEAAGLLLALFTSATAQTTWGGLRFGMTESEAKAALKTRSVRDVHKNPDSQPAGDDHSVYAAFEISDVAVNDFRGQASLLFSAETKRLQQVTSVCN
jgi:hypothetical protein